MAFQAYVSIKGTKQGQFKGESQKAERKDKWIEVLTFSYSLQVPLGAGAGQPSGKRKHNPIVITKEWGASSPQFLQACTTNESLSGVEFQFTKTDASGQEVVYQRITLTNASIVSFGAYRGALPPGPEAIGGRYESAVIEYGAEVVTGFGGAPARPGEVKNFGKFMIGDWDRV